MHIACGKLPKCLRRYTNMHEYTYNFSKIIHETFMGIHAYCLRQVV